METASTVAMRQALSSSICQKRKGKKKEKKSREGR